MSLAEPTGTYERTDIAFRTDDGITLRGWHFLPASAELGPQPLIIMHHGFSAVKEGYPEHFFEEYFAAAGFGVLTYDPRSLGESGGRIRQEIDPFLQVSDFRDAISFALTLPGVDPQRVGVWSASYGGGTAIQALAMDRRVHCLISTVPFLSGGAIWNMLPAEIRQNMLRLFETDRAQRAAGQAPRTVAIASEDPARTPCILPTKKSWEWCMRVAAVAPNWKNEVTVRSLESQFGFEPMAYVSRITPKSLLLIGAENDDLIPIALTREAFERAPCPEKDLVVLPCGHYSCYDDYFFQTAEASLSWFDKHLRPAV